MGQGANPRTVRRNGYQLYYHVYCRNGVMGDLEPIKESRSHEYCIAVEGVAPTLEMAKEVAMIGTRQMFYARLPDVKGTAAESPSCWTRCSRHHRPACGP